MQPILAHWHGLARDLANVPALLQVEAILPSWGHERGGSLPFRAVASDGNIYWVKVAHSKQGPKALVTEQIVAACGKMIGAPVCDVALINIPPTLDGEMLDSGIELRAGTAHGSLHVDNALFNKFYFPEHRERDDNRRRHAGYYALYDWCWGDDMQWLYDAADDLRTYSHDHGQFLPGGSRWTVDTLQEAAEQPREIDPLATGLDSRELARLALAIDNVSRDELCAMIRRIPTEWHVQPNELESLGWFLECRQSGVSARLRILAERNASLD